MSATATIEEINGEQIATRTDLLLMRARAASVRLSSNKLAFANDAHVARAGLSTHDVHPRAACHQHDLGSNPGDRVRDRHRDHQPAIAHTQFVFGESDRDVVTRSWVRFGMGPGPHPPR